MPIHAVALALSLAASADSTPAPRPPVVRVDSSATAITITITNLRIGAGDYAEAREERVSFAWPASGWMRGYQIDVLDSLGRLMPRATLHHAGVVNPERRQLAYPLAERLVAAGRETAPVTLPARLGVPITAGQPLVAYFMMVNPTDHEIDGVALRLTFLWTPAATKHRPHDTFPLFLDANPAVGPKRTFSLPPGVSVTTAEFTLPVGGRMRAMGAHLHDYAREIRLEDVASGRIIARLRTNRDEAGRLRAVGVAKFPLTRGGLRLNAGTRYRVVAIYDNPTCETIPDGAMAFLAGPFIPDRVSDWPAVDKYDPAFRADAAVGGEAAAATHDAHAGHGTAGAHDVGVDKRPPQPACR